MVEAQFPQPKRRVATQDLTGAMIGRFAVRARLGAGGMGEVYRADDTKLKRPVALKRLGPLLRDDPLGRSLFLKEAERASALSDQHIAAVYDVLEESGEIFLVMEYVEGVTLRRRLSEPVATEDFLAIAIQCAQGLAAAHEKGIIHRDLKPENIMLTPAGQVKILDFGIAKRLPRAGRLSASVTSQLETEPGKLVGTPAYMAPEVLLEGAGDLRADIFSLGVVFYEALTGRQPFLAESLVATADRVLHEQPPPLNTLIPKVPLELDRIVSRMMVKESAGRYASAAEVLTDLRRVRAGPGDSRLTTVPPLAPPIGYGRRRLLVPSLGLALLLVILGTIAGRPARKRLQRWLGIEEARQAKALAVLPFRAMGDGPRNQAFGEGLSETLSARLAQLAPRHALEVVSAGEVRAQGVTSADKAFRTLGVNLVLEGSVRGSGGMTRVTYAVVDARTLRELTADTVTVPDTDTFTLEDRVAEKVFEKLDIELATPQRRASSASGTVQPAAYDYYLQGRGYLQDYQKPENVESAITVFHSALQLDPRYAPALAGLGEAYWQKYQGDRNREWINRALAACREAVAVDSRRADGHSCLGNLYAGTGAYEEAVREFQEAARLDPTNDNVYRGLAEAYQGLGKPEEAERTFRQAINLRPHYWGGYNRLGAFYYEQARYAEAVAMFAQVVALAPDNFSAYSNQGGAYIAQGRYAEAMAAFERSVAIRPTASAYSNLATTYFYLRRFAEAARTYEKALELDERQYMAWGNLGDAYYWAAGKRTQAARAYQHAISLANQELNVNPRDARVLGYLASYHAMLGEKDAALSRLRRALRLAPRDPELLFNAALVHNQLGNAGSALGFLQTALSAGFSPSTLRNTPNFDNLRGNSRFRELLGRR